MSSSERLISTPEDTSGSFHAVAMSLSVRRTRLSSVGDWNFPVDCSYLEESDPTCHVHTLCCLVLEVASRLSCLVVPSLVFHRNICSACALTVVVFRHFNCYFYLLTYLSEYSDW